MQIFFLLFYFFNIFKCNKNETKSKLNKNANSITSANKKKFRQIKTMSKFCAMNIFNKNKDRKNATLSQLKKSIPSFEIKVPIYINYCKN